MGTKIFLALACALIAAFSFVEHRELESEREHSRAVAKNLEQSKAQLKTRIADLEAANARLKSFDNMAKKETDALQDLERALVQQRALVEQKQRDYTALMTGRTSVDPQHAAKIKDLNDDIALMESKLKSTQDATNYERDVSQSARDQESSNVDFQIAQINSRIQDAQAAESDLKTQKQNVPRGRLHPESVSTIANLNQQIAQAGNQVKAFKTQRTDLQAQHGQDKKQINDSLKTATNNLTREQNQYRQKIQADRDAIKRLDEVRGVAGGFDKERAQLLGRLEAELKDETQKLKSLEDQVHQQRARMQSAPSS